MSEFLRPRPVQPTDELARFDCGEPSLNDWLRQRALRNEKGGASRTFVTVERATAVVAGYYRLSAGSLISEEAPGGLKRNMPNPIPIILIGRLAVDNQFKGSGVGASLLQDAMLKSVEASSLIGARAVLVHALNDGAVSFYQRFGFVLVPHSATAMYLLMADAEATIAATTE